MKIENKKSENKNWYEFSINEELNNRTITQHINDSLIYILNTIEDQELIEMILESNNVAV